MGFNRCYVGNIIQIHKELNELGIDNFVNRYQKYDSITGDSESVNFIQTLVQNHYNQLTNKKSIEKQ